MCYCDLGLLLGKTGQVDRAFREYDRAHSIQEKLSAANRANTRLPALLARTELNAGRLYEQTGKIVRVQNCYTRRGPV